MISGPLLKRFAEEEPRSFASEECIFRVGDRAVPTWFILEGSVDLFGRDGLDDETSLRQLESGQFTGEVNQLAGRAVIARARAGSNGATALPFDAAHLRALMIGSAEIGEVVMRALILRRVGLIEEGGAGTIIIGEPGSRDVVKLQTPSGPEDVEIQAIRYPEAMA